LSSLVWDTLSLNVKPDPPVNLAGAVFDKLEYEPAFYFGKKVKEELPDYFTFSTLKEFSRLPDMLTDRKNSG
jgi:hypothetical protein